MASPLWVMRAPRVCGSHMCDPYVNADSVESPVDVDLWRRGSPWRARGSDMCAPPQRRHKALATNVGAISGLKARQAGAVLLVSLLFLLLMNIAVATTTRGSSLQLRMAGNEQSRLEARQRVMAVLDGIINDLDNFPAQGGIGHRICAAGSAGSHCDERLIELSADLTHTPGGGSLDFYILRKGPLETDLPGGGENGGEGDSERDAEGDSERDAEGSGENSGEKVGAIVFKAAHFEIFAEFDGSGAGLASSSMTRGVMVKVAAQSQPQQDPPPEENGGGRLQVTAGGGRTLWQVYWRETGIDRL